MFSRKMKTTTTKKNHQLEKESLGVVIGMDPSSVLDQTIQDVSNLQAEFAYILGELRSSDTELLDQGKKYMQKDSQIHKFIRQHGSLQEHPKEQELSEEIREEMLASKNLQEEKCTMANTALYLVAKHLAKLEKNVSVLEDDGLLAPVEEEADSSTEFSRESSAVSGTGERRRKAGSSGSHEPSNVKRRRTGKASSPNQISKTSSIPLPDTSLPQPANSREDESHENTQGSPLPVVEKDVNFDLQDYNDDLFSGYNNNEEEDRTLYCFCQSVSYGEMVACDGPNCKYEWFHYSCVNLKEPPKGQWYCPDCRQEMAKDKLKKKRI